MSNLVKQEIELPTQQQPWLVNNWMIFPSFKGMSCTTDKKFVVMHPMLEGHYYKGFDTLEECLDLATEENFTKWSKEYLS